MSDGSVTIEVTLTKEQLEKGLKSIKSDLNGLSKTGTIVNKIGSAISGIGSAMTKAGKIIVGATTGIIASLGTAINRFDTLKNYPKVLSNLGFSAEDAKESINELSEGIDGLPTALDDAASGVQRLVAKNGDIKKSTKYFLAMNDAVVAGNAPAQQQASAIEQLTQAYSKGKPDLMEWRTLMMAMPGQLKQVATAMGYVDTDELYEALQKGRVSMDQFMDAIVELDKNGGNGFKSFQEQAHNSCDSIGTAIANLKNRLKKGLATILQGLDEMASNTSFGSLAGMINEFSTSIKNFLDKIGESLKNSQSLKDFFEKISNTLIKLKDTINNLSPEQIDKIVTAFINLVKLGPELLVIGKGLSILGGIIQKVGTLVSVFSKLKTAFTAGGAGVKALSTAFTFLTGPVGIVIAIILAVITALVLLYKKSEIFRNAVNKAFEEIKNALMKAWQTMKPALESLWNSIKELMTALKPVADFLVGVLCVALAVIVKVLTTLIPIITKIIVVIIEISTKILTVVISVITKIISFFTTTLPNAFTSFIENVKNFVTSVIEWFKNLPYNIGYLIGQIIGHIVQWGINFANWVKEDLPRLIQGIIEWFKQLPSRLWTFLLEAINKIVKFGQDMGTRGKEGAKNLFNNIINTIRELPSKMLEMGRNIVEGLWNGIKNAASWIKDKVRNFASGLLDGMKEALGIHSPSTLFRDQVGKNIALGIGEGFEDNIAKVYRQMKSTVDFETQKLSTNLSATAMMSKVITANINVNGNVEMDKTKVGRLVAPSVSKTLRTAGA